jgi:hypothetical protein
MIKRRRGFVDYEVFPAGYIEFFDVVSGEVILTTPTWDIFSLAPVLWCKLIGFATLR